MPLKYLKDISQLVFSSIMSYIVLLKHSCIIKMNIFYRLLDNSDWYKDTNIIDFLSKTGRYFRMSQMLAKHR